MPNFYDPQDDRDTPTRYDIEQMEQKEEKRERLNKKREECERKGIKWEGEPTGIFDAQGREFVNY